MAIQLGSAYGKVGLDVKGFLFGIDKSKAGLKDLSATAQKIGADMKRVGQMLTVGVTLPLVALGTQSVKLASDLVETKSKVKVVFGDMTDYVMDWSKNSAQSMQLSRQEALEAASTFGNLFVAMKIGRPEAAEMSTTLVQLAGDLASINNLDPSQVLIKLKSGIVGETEAVRDLGIDLRQTTVEAKAMEMGFREVNGVFSQSDLIAARYAIILEQTRVAQGDIARTGHELAGQMRKLNAQWKDALAAIGQNLLPIVLKVVQWLNKMLEAFNNMSPAQQKVIFYIVLFVAAVGPLLIVLGTLLTTIRLTTGSLNPFSGGIIGLIFSFVKLIAAAAIVVKVLTFLGISTGPVGAAILGLNGAIAGTATTIWSALIPAITAVGTALLPVLVVLAALIIFIGLFYLAWKTNFLWLRDNIKITVNTIKLIWQAFTAFLRGDTDAAKEYLVEAWTNIVDTIKARFEKMFGWIQPEWNKFLEFMRTMTGTVVTYIFNIRNALDEIRSGTVKLYEDGSGALLELAKAFGLPEEAAQEFLARVFSIISAINDIRSGAIKLYEDGSGALLDLAVAFGFPEKTIQKLLARVFSIISAINEIRSGAIKLYEDGSGALLELAVAFGLPEKAAQEFLAKIYSVIDQFRTLFARARDYIINAFNTTSWTQLGKYITQGIANGILQGIASLVAAATKAAESVMKAIQSKLGIHSRSTVFEKFGMFSGEGYKYGLAKSMSADDIARTMARPVNQMTNSQQQTIINNFAGGLTIREVQSMIDTSAEALVMKMSRTIGGI